MTAPPKLVDAAGRPLPLDQKLAEGGEGAVYTVANDPGSVAKVYLPGKGASAEKLTTLLSMSNPSLRAMTAWPKAVLFHHGPGRRFAGFVMDRLTDCQLIQSLYNPAQRLKYFPKAGWNFQVRAALNVAAAFDELHKAGCLMGDVNEKNAMVSPQALVRLIDCDSFQVRANGRQFLCEVGVIHYTPPELIGRSFVGLTRTENHDRYGLAVFIYQLLFVGRHPYMGIYTGPGDPPFEQLIREFRFAQGPACLAWQMKPPPFTPTFADIPPAVGELFRRAFEKGSDQPNARPKPADWLTALKRLEPEVTTCSEDSGHKYWKGAGGCVWCRVADRGGPEYYFGVGNEAAAEFVVDETKLQNVLRRLAAVQAEDLNYNRRRYMPASLPAGHPPPPASLESLTRWRAARQQLQLVVRERERVERAEVDRIDAEEARRIRVVGEQLRSERERLDEEIEEERAAARAEAHERRFFARLLVGVAVAGIPVLLAGVFHVAFALVGLAVITVFGAWAAVYTGHLWATDIQRHLRVLQATGDDLDYRRDELVSAVRAESARDRATAKHLTGEVERHHRGLVQAAEQEYLRRIEKELSVCRGRVGRAACKVTELETAWVRCAGDHQQRRQAGVAAVQRLCSECRALGASYDAEVLRLAANAESAARLRHLRLFALADATIPQIGVARKQLLTSHGIHTAADVDEDRLDEINGFRSGKLRGHLLDWRDDVLRQFRFNPASALSPASLRTVTSRYTDQQRRLAVSLMQHVGQLESDVQTCRNELQPLEVKLRATLVEWEQAKADLAVLEANAA